MGQQSTDNADISARPKRRNTKWKNYQERIKADGSVSRFINPTIGGKQTWIRIPDEAQYGGKRGYERFLAETLARDAEKTTAVRFSEAADEWLGKYSRSKPATYSSYQTFVENHLKPYFGPQPLKNITSKHFVDFVERKMKEGLNRSYVRQMVWVFRAIYDPYVDAGLLKAHPGKVKIEYRQTEIADDELDKYEADRQGGRGLAPDEANALITNIYPYYQPMVALMVWTGLRIGEVLAMQWRYLDVKSQVYSVERNLNRKGQLGTPKTAASRAKVTLSRYICDWLERHRAEQAAERLRTLNWKDQDLIWASSGPRSNQPGAPRKSRAFAFALSSAAKRAGIGHVRPHDLRHTCATLLIQKQRRNIKEVSVHLRHANPTITQEIYGHLYPEDLPAMAAAMDELFLGEKQSFL